MPRLFNKKTLESNRKHLRNHSTSAESTLWLKLKNKQLEGRRFRRQHSVGNYILDFFCPQEKLAVELDGAGHFTREGQARDARRDEYLRGLGITVLRFENVWVFERADELLEEIRKAFSAG